MSSLKTLAIKGTIWTVFGYGASQALRLGTNLILTRLLVPEVFGLMALVHTFIAGLALFSDIGTNPSIIRSQRGEDPEFLNTAWTLQVIRGGGLWISCFIIAIPVSQFYNEPKLVWLIPVVGFNTITSGFYSTSLPVLTREMEVGKSILIEMTTQITAVGIMITWAYFQPTVWALVIGTLASNMVKLCWSHYISPIRHRFTWNQDCLKELVTFGRWIFLSTAMTFLAEQSDRLILGRLFSFEMLGVYTIAFTIANIPKEIASRVCDRVLFPVISKKIDLPRQQLKEKIMDKRKHLLVFLAFVIALLFSFGDIMVGKLYDERYKDAVWMLPILSLGIWPLALSYSLNKSLFALGKPQYGALGNFLKFFYMIFMLPLSFKLGGLFWVIVTIAFNDLPIYVITSYGLIINGLSMIKQDIISTILLGLFIRAFTLIRLFAG